MMKRKIRLNDVISKALIYLLLISISIVVITPVIWIVGSSFNPGTSLYSSTLIPKNPTFQHYIDLFTETEYLTWYLNTLKIATFNMIISVCITSITAYAFARFKFKGKKPAMMTVLLLQMFPSILTMVAVYIILMKLNLLNTHAGLILVYASGQIPYNTWLVKGYFGGIPMSLDEAAKIDGASNMTIFTKIILPLARPIIVLVALTNFMGPWFDFIFPRLILRHQEKWTLALGLFNWVTEMQNEQFTRFAAGAILVAVPITLLFVFLQKHIVEGLSSGATKG